MTTIGVTVNGEPRRLPAGTALDALVAELAGPAAGTGGKAAGIAAAVNESVVPRGRWSRTALREGDRIEVLTAVQGG